MSERDLLIFNDEIKRLDRVAHHFRIASDKCLDQRTCLAMQKLASSYRDTSRAFDLMLQSILGLEEVAQQDGTITLEPVEK